MANDQRGIQSVEVGGQLLRVLTESDRPMMLRDLASSAGMPPAKAHPYLVSFVRLGLVGQDRASGHYELGPLALQMGLASMRRLDPVRVATEAIPELVLGIWQTVALAVWGNYGPTVVWIEEAGGAVHVNMRIGSAMSLLGTATGRVFAAFLPPKMIENFVATGIGSASVGDEAARQMSGEQIAAAVAEVRERGLARAVGPIPGVNAFSLVPPFLTIRVLSPSPLRQSARPAFKSHAERVRPQFLFLRQTPSGDTLSARCSALKSLRIPPFVRGRLCTLG